MPLRHLLHHFHGKLIMVCSYIRSSKNGCKLVLCRSRLVMLCLSKNTKLPKLLIKVMHKVHNTRLNASVIMVVQLLSLGRLSSEKSSACENKVGTLMICILFHKEIFLFGADCSTYVFNVFMTEKLHDTCRLFINGFHTAKKRCLLVKCFATVGTKCSGNTKCIILDKGIARRVPRSISACFKGSTKSA